MAASKSKKKIFSALGVLLIFNILAWIAVSEIARAKTLEVIFFDIGQGDAAFIETPKGHQILIDGGPGSQILEKLGKQMPFYDRSIDLIILTHPEKDHMSGLIEVLKRYKVDCILWTGIKREAPELEEWLRLIEEKGIKTEIAVSGQKIKMGNVEFDILSPFENLSGEAVKNVNDTSIVLKMLFGNDSFLFTGDISVVVEAALLKEGADIDSDVLKVSHHGSKNSNLESFIWEVSPEISVISSAKNNSYGHPHLEVLEVLSKFGIKILRTDLEGDIKIYSDGNTFKN